MKKTYIILILTCLLISCRQNSNDKKQVTNEKPIQYFLTYRLIDNEFIETDIDTLANFRGILDAIEKIDCNENYALFKLETEDKIFKIQPLQFCGDFFDYKLREIIYINTDSVTINYELKYPIDSLKTVLNNHLRNPNNDRNYPSIDDKKLISVNVDNEKNIKETKNLLLKIIENINGLENKTNFGFMFEDGGIIQVVEE